MGIGIGLLVSIAFICAYWMGFKHGKAYKNGYVPNLNINPIKMITEHIETKKMEEKQSEFEKEWEQIANFDASMALEAIKQERVKQ